MDTILKTDFSKIKLFNRGKVRDVYEIGDNLLIVATDRLSAFDVVMPNGIPFKGAVLTGLSLFWFQQINHIMRNHLVSADVASYPEITRSYRSELAGRSMLVKKARPIMIECVVRGYLAGSAFNEYKKTGEVTGYKLPAGLGESARLPEPIFTPAVKATSGHDQNVSFAEAANQVGRETAAILKEKSLKIYLWARDYAEKKGIILADTKFEFGFDGSEIILIDEVLTPDSSRFWGRDSYREGISPPSFDKQYVRDYLETLNWDKTPPGPELPPEVITKTSKKYLEAFEKLTGRKLAA